MNADESALATAQNLVGLRRWQDALDALGPALASDDTAYQAFCLSALCLLQGRPAGHRDPVREAGEAARTALSHNPDGEWAHRLLAVILLQEGRRAAALRAAEQAVRLQPHEVLTLVTLAECQLGACRHQQAERTARAAVALGPHEPAAYQILGKVASSVERWDEAERAYRAGLALDPQNETLVLGLAQVLLAQRRHVEASEAFLAAARLDPRGRAPAQALRQLANQMSSTQSRWRSQAPKESQIRDVIAECKGPVAAAFDEFWAVASQARARVDELLTQARDVVVTAAKSLGTQLPRDPAPGPFVKWPASGAAPGRLILNWSVLDLGENPVPGDPYGVGSAIRALERAREEAAGFGEQFAAVATATLNLHVEGDDGSTFHEVAVNIHRELSGLTAAYQACGKALPEFCDALQLARSQIFRARGWAETAINAEVVAGVAPRRPGYPQLADRPRSPEQEAKRQRVLRESEEERLAAIETVKAALGELSAVETRCAEAIRSVTGAPITGSQG